MKKVAATSGQSVSFADFLFVWEITRGRAVAGSETVLNFCRFLLGRARLARAQVRSKFAQRRIQALRVRARKILLSAKDFCTPRLTGRRCRTAQRRKFPPS